nr:hypothetical protein [Tanacetum cinerariifolium]
MRDNKSHGGTKAYGGNIDGEEWCMSKGSKDLRVSKPPTSTLTGIIRLDQMDSKEDYRTLTRNDISYIDATMGSRRMPEKTIGSNLDKDKVDDEILQLDVDESLRKRLNMWYILKENMLEEGKFDDLKIWEDDFVVSKRLAWIKLDVIPVISRNRITVTGIARKFGKVEEVGDTFFNTSTLNSVRVLILIPLNMDVNRTLKVKDSGLKVFSDETDTETLGNFKKRGENHHSSCMEEDELATSSIPMENAWVNELTNYEAKVNDSLENSSNSGVLGHINTSGPSIDVVPHTQLGQDQPNESYVSRGKRIGEIIGFVYDNGAKVYGNPSGKKVGLRRLPFRKTRCSSVFKKLKMEFIDSFLVKSI